jgi:hypothetical protein
MQPRSSGPVSSGHLVSSHLISYLTIPTASYVSFHALLTTFHHISLLIRHEHNTRRVTYRTLIISEQAKLSDYIKWRTGNQSPTSKPTLIHDSCAALQRTGISTQSALGTGNTANRGIGGRVGFASDWEPKREEDAERSNQYAVHYRLASRITLPASLHIRYILFHYIADVTNTFTQIRNSI